MKHYNMIYNTSEDTKQKKICTWGGGGEREKENKELEKQ
jgi:hypothetical protein